VLKIIQASDAKPMSSKVGWYGNLTSPLKDVPEYLTRPKLKAIADANSTLLDIIHIAPNRGIIDANIENYMTLEDLVRNYKYLLDIGGNGYSGRLKYLLFSKRPLILVERRYVEYFHDDLLPFVHYIPVKTDLSDLIDKILWIHSNEKVCEQIAENALQFAKTNFTKEKLCQRIMQVYSHIISDDDNVRRQHTADTLLDTADHKSV
jgi:hypothetical protein